AWSEVRVLPSEHESDPRMGRLRLRSPIDTALEPMFYRLILVCQQCGAEFPVVLVLRGKPRDLRGRKHCVDCRPYRELGRPRKPVIRAAKALIWAACGKAFPAKQLIDGKMHSLYRRRFCLDCSPF